MSGAYLKIVVVHNAYQQRGGEDSVVDEEVLLLRSRGHEVHLFTRHNDALVGASKLKAAIDTMWARDTAKDLESLLVFVSPDVVHVHNTFPQISPAAYWVADRLGIPVIQTLHNFRLHCPQAMYLRDGKLCEDCVGRVPWRGAMRGCYRDSVLQSTVLAGMLTLHRVLGTWEEKVTRYIALNDFCKAKFVEGGLPAERIAIKPNFVDFEAPPIRSRDGFLFVGRLSKEKGIDVLTEAHQQTAGSVVKVAGTGPEDYRLKSVPGILALGSLSLDQVRQEMVQASALVLPSIWYENFPRTLVEAYACGLPVIASRIGALAELVTHGETGLLFDAGKPDSLAEAMRWAMDNPDAMARMGRKARAKYEAEFTAEINYQQLMKIYESAITEVKSRAMA